MKIYVGVTDNDWWKFLAELQPEEVNFWRPSGGAFRALKKWEPFLFKLHSPQNYIAGGGFYVTYSPLPLSFAWETFGKRNGVANYETFYEKIRRYRRGEMERDPYIGCIILTEPFFFKRSDWIPVPDDWHPNIVQGKTYDTNELHGKRLWENAQALLQDYRRTEAQHEGVHPIKEPQRYGEEYTIRPRLGQGGFRVAVTEAYGRRGAITGERILPVLQASHIKPHAESGPNRVENGLLLRADLHILFDRGYLTVTKDHRVEASRRLKEEFDNGEEYYRMHGKRLRTLPRDRNERPSPQFLQWHNDNVFTP